MEVKIANCVVGNTYQWISPGGWPVLKEEFVGYDKHASYAIITHIDKNDIFLILNRRKHSLQILLSNSQIVGWVHHLGVFVETV